MLRISKDIKKMTGWFIPVAFTSTVDIKLPEVHPVKAFST
jgi:hypothetical protein